MKLENKNKTNKNSEFQPNLHDITQNITKYGKELGYNKSWENSLKNLHFSSNSSDYHLSLSKRSGKICAVLIGRKDYKVQAKGDTKTTC